MRTKTFLAAILILSSSVCSSQALDNTIDKVDNTVDQVNKASETFGKLKGLLPKKKNKNVAQDTARASTQVIQPTNNQNVVTSSSHVTLIKITGVDYATLKKLNSNIQACEGVQEAKMKFGADSSSIEIKHSGTTDSLMSVIELTSKDIFTDNNIVALEDGLVAIKLK